MASHLTQSIARVVPEKGVSNGRLLASTDSVGYLESMSQGPPVVAIFNTSPDTIEMLRLALAPAGFIVMGAYTYELRDGVVDVEALVKQHHPELIIFDVAPPYDANWRLLQHFMAMPVLKGINFLVTTTNRNRVIELAGDEREIYEIVGKPYDLGLIVQAVKDTIGVPELDPKKSG